MNPRQEHRDQRPMFNAHELARLQPDTTSPPPATLPDPRQLSWLPEVEAPDGTE